MTKKFKKFEFDFNEDAEPVAELHRLRAALSKRFKTTKALNDYYAAAAEERRREEKQREGATPTATVTKRTKAKPAAKTPVRPRRKALVKAKSS